MPRAPRSTRTTTINTLSASIAEAFGTRVTWTAVDLTGRIDVNLTPTELRGAIAQMHYNGMLNRKGTCRKTGLGMWVLTSKGLARANAVMMVNGG